MIFRQMLPGQKLILIKDPGPRPPASPIAARRPAAQPDPLLIRLLLWLCATFARPALRALRRSWPPPIWAKNRYKLAALVFLAGVIATVILENLAADYINRALGG